MLNRFFKVASLASALAFLVSVSSASAAMVTLNEAALDSIFSQASFATTPIDIRFDPVTTLVAPNLLDISTGSLELAQLASSTTAPVIPMAFVDSFDGNPSGGTIGLGRIGGPGIAVNSGFAANPVDGPSLLAHEIGHNLGLHHVTGTTVQDLANLMYPVDNGQTLLTTAQVAIIMASNLVQRDLSGYFLEIQPILVSAVAPVPLPAGGLLLISALGMLAFFRRRSAVVPG